MSASHRVQAARPVMSRRIGIALLVWGALSFVEPAVADPPTRADLSSAAQKLSQRLSVWNKLPSATDDLRADAQIFLKGALWALDLEENLDEAKSAQVQQALQRAVERIDELESAASQNRLPRWTNSRGRLIRGFVSRIDDSVQPFGLIVPSQYHPQKPIRLDVVLHGSHGGRAGGTGDLQFLGPFDSGDEGSTAPDVSYMEVHPMGRLGENAYRFEGETDVFEAVEAVCRNYNIDRKRIVLRGSSLGGVGTWQIGLKRPDLFVALGPTAGPVDTIEFANSPWPHFVRLEPLTPWQKRMLHLVDAIDYTANAAMVPVVAAMGDQDHYFSSHLLIKQAFADEGIPFVGLIDVGGGHGVRPPVIAEQLRLIGERAGRDLDRAPRQIRFVTWTLKFSRCHWIEILGLGTHYERAEIKARQADDGSISIDEPRNISRFSIDPAGLPVRDRSLSVAIGGTAVPLPVDKRENSAPLVFERQSDRWIHSGRINGVKLTGKRPGLQGPIDDAFATRFLCVRGTGEPWNPAAHRWSDANLARFASEWKRHYRAELPVKNDDDVTPDDLRNCNLILFGDPGSNSWMAKVAPKLPIRWTRDELELGGSRYPSAQHGLALIFPNPLAGAAGRYIVFNSGHTYHDAELRFSYMVFPRLGDWAVMRLDTASSQAAGGTVGESVLNSGFFDESWGVPDSGAENLPGK